MNNISQKLRNALKELKTCTDDKRYELERLVFHYRNELRKLRNAHVPKVYLEEDEGIQPSGGEEEEENE